MHPTLSSPWPRPDANYYRAVQVWLHHFIACDDFDGRKGPPPPDRRADSARFARRSWGMAEISCAHLKLDDETLSRARDEACKISDLPNLSLAAYIWHLENFLAHAGPPATI